MGEAGNPCWYWGNCRYGGDPAGNGTGGPGHTVEGEFASNGFDNDLLHETGVISMARSGHPDSAGSQFFIMVGASPHLDGDYAGFGQVIEGVSTRKVTKIVEELCGESASRSMVSNLTKKLDPIVGEWASRPLNTIYYPYIYVDAMYIKVREHKRVVSKAV